MKIHPKIVSFIEFLNKAGIGDLKNKELEALKLLVRAEATSTEAMVTLHQGYNLETADAEALVNNSGLWEKEHIQDVFLQTALYMDYD